MAPLMLDLPEEIGSATETVEIPSDPIDTEDRAANETNTATGYTTQQAPEKANPHVVRWYQTWAGGQ